MAHCKDIRERHRILECPICLERIKDPRMLLCLHSFCEECIGRHMEERQENGSFPCPLCNTKFKVPQDGATGFKRNKYFEAISELFPESSKVKCEICRLRGLHSYAISMCINCTEGLCQQCAQYHCFTKASLDHMVVKLEDVRNGQHIEEILRFQYFQCRDHPTEELKIYCEDCKTCLCVVEHDHHKKVNVKKAAANVSDVLEKLLVPWRQTTEHHSALSAERKRVLDNLDQQEEQLIHQAKKIFNDFKDKILQEIVVKEKQSIDDIKEQVAEARTQAEEEHKKAETSASSSKQTLEYVENILQSAQDVEKLQQFQDIRSRLEALDTGKVENEVIVHLVKLQPDSLEVPSVSVSAVRKCLEKQVGKPLLKEQAAHTLCFNSMLPGEPGDCNYGLAVNDKWFITTSQKKVKFFDRVNGEFMFEVNQDQHELDYAMSVTCNKKGEIFVTDQGTHVVVKYNEKGQFMKVSAPDMYSKDWGAMVCHGDELILTDKYGGRVLMVDSDCNITQVINKESLGLSEFLPAFVCIDNDGHLVVGDHIESSCRIHVIDYKKSIVIKTCEHLDSFPFGVCVDEWGHILVAFRETSQVVLISDESKQARVIATSDEVSRPTDLAVTGPGEVAALEEKTGNVKLFKYADFLD